MVLCVLCAAEVKLVEHAMLPAFIYTFSDIQMNLTVAVTTPFILIQEFRNSNSHM